MIRARRNRPAHDVDTAAIETVIVGMASVARRPEVLDTPAAMGKRSLRVRGKERPYIKVFHTMGLSHEVLRSALAEGEKQKTIPISPARFRAAIKQTHQICHCQIRETAEVVGRERFK